jgi:hypothetical protein
VILGQAYRKPDYWISGIRRRDGVKLTEAFVRNCGNQGLDDKGEIQIAKTIRMRVLMRGTGAGQLVVVMKFL